MPLVIILHAPEEESIAERLVDPIRSWGYEVWHTGNVLVGDVVVKELSDRLADNGPVVINGTTRAAGSKWLKTILGHLQGHNYGKRVLPVRVEIDANLEGVVLGAKIAECVPNFFEGLRQLRRALEKNFPRGSNEIKEEDVSDTPQEDFDNWLTSWTYFSEGLLRSYREKLRQEIRESKLGDDLDSLTFLSRANLMANGRLYASGVILLTDHPEGLIPSAFTQCVKYYGTTKDSGQKLKDIYGSVVDQIEGSLSFVSSETDRVEIIEPGDMRRNPSTAIR